MLKKLLAEIKGDGLSMGEPGSEIKDEMNDNENFGSYIKRTQDFSDSQILKLAVNYNALVFGLDGRTRAVDKPRFIEIEENLEEVVEIKDSMEQIIEQLQGLGDSEEKVHKDVESELENIPHDLEQMNQLGDDLIKLKKEIKTVEEEDEELVKIEEKTQLGSHPQTHEKVDKELNKEEKILSDLEHYIEKLVDEVAELEAESEKFEELDKEEQKELERVINREDGLLEIADELQREWIQESKVLFGKPSSNNNQNSLDSELEGEINKIFNTLRKTCTIISNTAKKLGKYSEQEYRQTERFAEIEEDFYQEEKRELENLSFSNQPKASQGPSVRSTAAD